MEKLATLLMQQTALSAQQEERMVAIMECLLSPGGATPSCTPLRPAVD